MQIVALNQDAISNLEEREKAKANSDKAQRMLQQLMEWDPHNVPWQRDWAVNLTVVAELASDHAEARRSYENAIQKLEGLVNSDPSNMDWALDLASARDSFGRYLGDTEQDLQGALKQFDAAMPILEKIMQIDSSNFDVRLSRDVELTWRSYFERRRGSERDIQIRLLRTAIDSLMQTRKDANESVRAADVLLFAERESCLSVPAESRPRAKECQTFIQEVAEQVKAPLPGQRVSDIWNHYTWLEDKAANQADKAALYRSGLNMMAVAVGHRPGDEDILKAVEAAIEDTSSFEAGIRPERLNLVRAADPGGLTGVRRGAYLERVHDLYRKLDDKNAALVALRGAIDANPTEPRLYQKSADLHFSLGQAALASNFRAAQSEFQSSIAAQAKCVGLAPQDPIQRGKLWQRHIDVGKAVSGSDNTPKERQRIDFAQAQYSQASTLLQHEIVSRPKDDKLYTNLFDLIGWQFTLDWNTRDHDGAWQAYQSGIAAAQKAVDLQPDKSDYWHLLQEAHYDVGVSVSYWDDADAAWRTRARAALRAAADASRKSIEKDPELPKIKSYFEEIATSLAAAAELMEKDSMREDAARTFAEACVALDHATALTTAEAAAKTKDSEGMQALRQRCSGSRTVLN
jgi:tetratricopeptide (TPR) repeat protein